MGHRSLGLILILVVGAAFSLLFASDATKHANDQAAVQELQYQSPSALISRTVRPENICFQADANAFSVYPAFVEAIKAADNVPDLNRGTIPQGNYYGGVAIDLNQTQMFALLRLYNFNQTILVDTIPNGLFTYKNTIFQCGLSYNERYYHLWLTFTELEHVNRDKGYLTLQITPHSNFVNGNVLRSYAAFNNTLVAYNDSPSPVTLSISGQMQNQTISHLIKLPPNGMRDVFLQPNWNTPNDTNYHYMVKEYPSIQGTIDVSTKYVSECIAQAVAKSLYLQSDFDVAFPSYLPNGFRNGCNDVDTEDSLIQVYVNQTAVDHFRSNISQLHPNSNPYPYRLDESLPPEDKKGVIIIDGTKYHGECEYCLHPDRYYQALLNGSGGYDKDIRLFEHNGTSYIYYLPGGSLPIVEVFKQHEIYRVSGQLSTDEIIKVAESL